MSQYPYDEVTEPVSVGIDERLLNQVVQEFKRQQADGVFPGSQLVVRRKGRLVLNTTCGIARGMRPDEGIAPVAVQPDTPFPVLSAGKPMQASGTAMKRLVGTRGISL